MIATFFVILAIFFSGIIAVVPAPFLYELSPLFLLLSIPASHRLFLVLSHFASIALFPPLSPLSPSPLFSTSTFTLPSLFLVVACYAYERSLSDLNCFAHLRCIACIDSRTFFRRRSLAPLQNYTRCYPSSAINFYFMA